MDGPEEFFQHARFQFFAEQFDALEDDRTEYLSDRHCNQDYCRLEVDILAPQRGDDFPTDLFQSAQSAQPYAFSHDQKNNEVFPIASHPETC